VIDVVDAVRFRDRRDGKILVEIPNGSAGWKLFNYMMYDKGYKYAGSGAFIIERWAEQIHDIIDKAKELGLKVEGLE